MENPHVDVIFGMHLIPDEETAGEVVFHKGPLTTSVDLFDITVKGKGGHGSTPHLTKDPILAACQMVNIMQQIQARYTDPLETVIFPVCSFHSGDAPKDVYKRQIQGSHVHPGRRTYRYRFSGAGNRAGSFRRNS